MYTSNAAKKSICKSIVLIIIMFLFQQAASKTGAYIAEIFDYSKIDMDNTYAFISVHHIVQTLISLTAILMLQKIKKLEFNLKFRYSKTGVTYTLIFTGVIFIYVFLSYYIGYKINSIASYNDPFTAVDVVGTLGFQLFLSGPSEEILFRALPITIFLYINKSHAQKKYLSALFAALLFSLAHISWAICPFAISVNWFQLIYSFILGAVYGITYIKSGSILYSMVMHSMSNVMMVGMGYFFSCIQ